MNSTQTIAFLDSGYDILLIDIQNKKRIDLEATLFISDIRACVNDFGKFFILANKYHKTQGVFLIQIDESKINDKEFDETKIFIIKW